MLAATGEIRDMTVPWLFHDIRSAEKSGTVTFVQDKLIKKVYFSKGDILFASSNRNEDRLGEFLVRKGRINKEQFNASSEIVIKSGKKLGAVLIELGLLAPKDLVVQVKLQIKEIIVSLFSWRQGKYFLEEGNLGAADIIPLQMSTGNLVLEGVQALDWQVIRKGLPAMQTVVRRSAAPPIVQDTDLSADHKLVLSLIDGSKTIEQICSLTGIGDFNTLKSIYLLLATKMIEIGELQSQKEKSFVQAEQKNSDRAPGGQPLTKRQMIQEAFDALKNQDDFAVLGVNNTITPDELKKVYFKLAKRYHPDGHLEADMADMKDKLEALFSRTHDAYQRISASLRNPKQQPQPAPPASSHFEEKRAEDYIENYAEKKGRAATYFNSGMRDFTAGNFWGAADSFAWAVRLDHVTAHYFYYYGMALKRIPRRRHEAEENLKKAIEIDPLQQEYYLELGNLYLASGVKTKGLDVFMSGLKANPTWQKIKEAIQAAGGEVPKE